MKYLFLACVIIWTTVAVIHTTTYDEAKPTAFGFFTPMFLVVLSWINSGVWLVLYLLERKTDKNIKKIVNENT